MDTWFRTGRCCASCPPRVAPDHNQLLLVYAADNIDSLDLNTATEEQLKALPGIADAYSKKILEHRPYKRKDELVQTKVNPQATYDRIKDQIVAMQK